MYVIKFEMNISTIDLLIIIFYLGGILTLGILSSRRKKMDSNRYFLAGRSLNWAVIGAALFAAIVLPWHIAAALRDPQFVHFYIVVQHFQRISGQEHASPFWFFPAILPFGLLCWTALLFPASVKAFNKYRT